MSGGDMDGTPRRGHERFVLELALLLCCFP